MEGEEEFFVAHDFLLPGGAVDGLELVEGSREKSRPFQFMSS